MVNTFLDNYGNCSTFKLCNENEDFYKAQNNNEGEKDYKNLMMLTPPSKAHHAQKYLMMQSNQKGNLNYNPNNDENIKS